MTSNRHFDIQKLYQSLNEELLNSGTLKSNTIYAEFYPYSTLKNTIRRRDNAVIIRISDMLTTAPSEVMRALGIILLCKLEKKSIPRKEASIYRDYVNSTEMQSAIKKNRQKRVKKAFSGPKGTNYNLEKSFERINSRYFAGELSTPNLTWSKRKTKTRFGHHDEALNTIVISRTLDDKNLPVYLLDYIMFHEALHMKHKIFYRNRRRHVHTKAFKDDERMFSDYKKAKELLKKLSGGTRVKD